MSENITNSQAFKLKGRLYTLTVVHVLSTDNALFSEQLAQTVAKAPKLFDNTPVVLDLTAVHHLECDLNGLLQIARDNGMIPVAIQGGNPIQVTFAQCQGLAVLKASSSQDKPIIERPIEHQTPLDTPRSKIISVPVRSGQQIVAKGAHLIVTASVSHGAELLS
ncbi:MAG: septum site-determining protein MinC, partial [Legionellales bacterium]